MIKILPFIVVAVLVLGGLGYWRFQASRTNLITSQTDQNYGAIEIPSSAPDISTDERVRILEQVITKLVAQVNSLKQPSKTESSTSSADSKITALETAVADLKAKVAALEKASPAPVTTTSKSVVYIPLGSGGGPWTNIDWYTTPEYEITLDPANYPGYTGMVLEVNFRLTEAAGTGSVRLYNSSDSSVTSSQVDTTSTTFNLQSSSSFKLASGSKTYKLQLKSTSEKQLFIQSARIKVSF